ncbi:MAG: malto-oligosyltrehalose trehalohydrolase [Deltaproteobacteria bacterium]|nr:malto-oligosyltrehalose trehalohydrolase [Deltaproteobacteria bacterium]
MKNNKKGQTGSTDRRFPAGAEIIPGSAGAHFRIWAPKAKKVEALFENGKAEASIENAELIPEGDGYFSAFVKQAAKGTLYRYRLDEKDAYPDPASRFQPQGPHGPSEVIDPFEFKWTDKTWKGVNLKGQIIYEMHIGTFTKEGTWEAAARELKELARIGITTVEVMPISEFPGRFGWGYDGTYLYSPARVYGRPDDLRNFINTAHETGLGVILDVVYNHTGPEGCYLQKFSDDFFTDRYFNEWGKPINFDGDNSTAVREFFASNAQYWISEFHFDGFRFDATQTIIDNSGSYILAEISERVRKAASGRSVLLIAENEPQKVKLVKPVEEGGYGFDGLWNDDFHHSAMVALTGYHQAYYSDYRGTPQEFVSEAKRGYLFQGQRYFWQHKKRGTSTRGIRPETFINYFQNHDQVANSFQGLRANYLASPPKFRAMTALLLLMPGTPLIFQGQEFGSSSPFLYFADLNTRLMVSVKNGRFNFLKQFPNLKGERVQSLIPDPSHLDTFLKSKLDLSERIKHSEIYQMYKDLLKLRREDIVLSSVKEGSIDGAILGEHSFLLRYFGEEDERLLIVNLGADLRLEPAPEPLLAPPFERDWQVLWSSEDPCYGGSGIIEPDPSEALSVIRESAVLFSPKEMAK